MTRWKDVAVLLAIVLAAYVVGRCSERGRADTAALRVRTAVHQKTVDSLKVQLVLADTREQRWRDSTGTLEAQLRATRTRRVVAIARVDTARSQGDTAALVASLETVIVEQAEEIRQLTESVRLWQALYASADTGRAVLARALRESEALRVEWQRKASPGILERARRALPFVALGVVAWEAAR